MVIRQIGPGMIQQAQQQCGACRGSGSQIAANDKCGECHGEKTVKEKKTLEIHVNKGMKHGDKITFSGEADEAVSETARHAAATLCMLPVQFLPFLLSFPLPEASLISGARLLCEGQARRLHFPPLEQCERFAGAQSSSPTVARAMIQDLIVPLQHLNMKTMHFLRSPHFP